jgi:hypothetical protein
MTVVDGRGLEIFKNLLAKRLLQPIAVEAKEGHEPVAGVGLGVLMGEALKVKVEMADGEQGKGGTC